MEGYPGDVNCLTSGEFVCTKSMDDIVDGEVSELYSSDGDFEGSAFCKKKRVRQVICDNHCSGCCCIRKKLLRKHDGAGTVSIGEHVKTQRNVVQMRKSNRKRQPNINCRVEAFGRVIVEFDELRKKWVVEMGFGGLLHIVGLTLPRTLCYWLMTRLDPEKETIKFSDESEIILSPNHVRWVLGLPAGGDVVPRKIVTEEMRRKIGRLQQSYGLDCLGTVPKTGKVICSRGVTVTDAILDRLKGEWIPEDEEEFKMLFMLLSLYMILCPTQSSCLEGDLLPALTCAMAAREYDWCGLVLKKLMASVTRFAKRFDASGYAGGCGGCSIFVAIFYLDRLDRRPVNWGVWPRLKVWNAAELRRGSQEDRLVNGGDFGKLKSLRAVYGEIHPLQSSDKPAPEGECDSVGP